MQVLMVDDYMGNLEAEDFHLPPKISEVVGLQAGDLIVLFMQNFYPIRRMRIYSY